MVAILRISALLLNAWLHSDWRVAGQAARQICSTLINDDTLGVLFSPSFAHFHTRPHVVRQTDTHTHAHIDTERHACTPK